MKINIESGLIRHVLKNAYFINGTAFAGKSTVLRLLAEKYDGILCRENYHDELMDAIDKTHQPSLSFFSTMRSGVDFVTRTPEEYDTWSTGCSKEAAEMELILLLQKATLGKKLFVDTNIPIDILREISDYDHIAFMLCPREMSVDCFFNRPDRDKQWIFRQINASPDPEKTYANYRECIARVNSAEHYAEFESSGLFTFVRGYDTTLPEALSAIETHFKLNK